MSPLYIGETLSGLLPGLIALVQGSQKTGGSGNSTFDDGMFFELYRQYNFFS